MILEWGHANNIDISLSQLSFFPEMLNDVFASLYNISSGAGFFSHNYSCYKSNLTLDGWGLSLIPASFAGTQNKKNK